MNASTGPRTAAGKAISSQNALKHGLASNRLIIEGEDPADYQTNLDEFLTDLQPVGKLEVELATEIANAQWFKARALRFQAIAFDNHTPTPNHTVPPELGVLIRYQTTNERAFYRALKTLQTLQKERKSAPAPADDQFVSQNQTTAPAQVIPFPHHFVSQVQEETRRQFVSQIRAELSLSEEDAAEIQAMDARTAAIVDRIFRPNAPAANSNAQISTPTGTRARQNP
jgi:hypothetical protein